MKTSKELLKDLEKVDKATIGFDLPVLERIKLECLSFIPDETIESDKGKEIVIGDYIYQLGVRNTYHHLSIGRALFRLIRTNAKFGEIIDEKRLSVKMISLEVARLTQQYMDKAYLKAKEKGYGFDALKFHRLPDAVVDFNVLVEAIYFMKVDKPLENIEIYAFSEEIAELRKKIEQVKEAEKAAKKQADAKRAAKTSKILPVKEENPEPVKPKREDDKYDSLFGDVEYEEDLKEYEKLHAAWLKAKEDTDCEDEGCAVDVEDEDITEEDLDEEDAE